MDDSKDAFRAAQRVIDFKNDGETSVIPKVVAFHSTKHHTLPKYIPITATPVYGSRYTVPAADRSSLEKEYREKGKEILKKTEEMFDKNQILIETRLVTDEKPEDYVERIVEEENFDLVVLGCKGHHSKLKEVFMGTVAQKVVNDAPCDILIVR